MAVTLFAVIGASFAVIASATDVANDPRFTLTAPKSAQVGNEFSITIGIENNPGIATMRCIVN
ncbi:MAG: hypothetical protein FWH20_08750 [Oscillospiraceae bacterium]|nr:hypothetical protein [Oscillospiraceae bacterium]